MNNWQGFCIIGLLSSHLLTCAPPSSPSSAGDSDDRNQDVISIFGFQGECHACLSKRCATEADVCNADYGCVKRAACTRTCGGIWGSKDNGLCVTNCIMDEHVVDYCIEQCLDLESPCIRGCMRSGNPKCYGRCFLNDPCARQCMTQRLPCYALVTKLGEDCIPGCASACE